MRAIQRVLRILFQGVIGMYLAAATNRRGFGFPKNHKYLKHIPVKSEWLRYHNCHQEAWRRNRAHYLLQELTLFNFLQCTQLVGLDGLIEGLLRQQAHTLVIAHG